MSNDEKEDISSQDNLEDATMEEQEPEGNAGRESPEETLKVYRDLAEQQKAEIATLLENQKAMQAQIGQLIRGGASINEPSRLDISGNMGDSAAGGAGDNLEEYVSLSDLGADIGKRDYHNVNMKE